VSDKSKQQIQSLSEVSFYLCPLLSLAYTQYFINFYLRQEEFVGGSTWLRWTMETLWYFKTVYV